MAAPSCLPETALRGILSNLRLCATKCAPKTLLRRAVRGYVLNDWGCVCGVDSRTVPALMGRVISKRRDIIAMLLGDALFERGRKL